MSQLPYLVELAQLLLAGSQAFPEPMKKRHAEFLLRFQMTDGGFRGREGDSDLYYTSFAIRGLQLLGHLNDSIAEPICQYLQSIDRYRLNTIDLLNWQASALALQLSCGLDLVGDDLERWKTHCLEQFSSLRRGDGGFAKSEQGALSSTYHTFLVVLTYELLGESCPQPDQLLQFLDSRQRDDGGFVEIAPMRRGGTNPTAAAIVLWGRLQSLPQPVVEDVSEFLEEVQGEEGGYRANTRIPFSDTLSTFTGLLTERQLGTEQRLDRKRLLKLVTHLELDAGGFRAAGWDEATDVEYTYYALGILALLGAEGKLA